MLYQLCSDLPAANRNPFVFRIAASANGGSQPVQRIEIKALQQKLRAQRQVVDFVPGQPERWTDVRKDTGGPPLV